MTLKDQLYRITAATETMDGADYTLLLDSSDAIFRAHFPQMPVMPGVCIIQTAVELAEELWRHRAGDKSIHLSLQSAKSIKFTAVISPERDVEIRCRIENFDCTPDERACSFQAVVTYGEEMKAKMSLRCIRKPSCHPEPVKGVDSSLRSE